MLYLNIYNIIHTIENKIIPIAATCITVAPEHNNKQQNQQSPSCSSADTPAVCRCLWRW